jgi:arylsulfatase A-like enzyme
MRHDRYRSSVSLLVALLLAVLDVQFGQHGVADVAAVEKRPAIIFIVVDALRADHVSAYGYGRATTPHVDSLLAEQGTVFRDVTTASSWTNPSNGAMLIGRMPSDVDTVWADQSRRIPEEEMLLAEYLSAAGYQTVGFVSNWWLREPFGYAQGFDTYAHTDGADRDQAGVLNDLAQGWLGAHKDELQNGARPLFLFLYYYDPHTPYDPPPPYDMLYDPAYTGPFTPEFYGHGEAVVSGAVMPNEEDVAHLLALYDGEISYWDHELGEMAAYLDSLGLWQDSLIVLTSDHGQMFGEHGKWVHRNSLYEEVLRVPLLIRYPGTLPVGQVLDAPVSNLDILPTILDLVGIERPASLDGVSLRPLLQGENPPPSRLILAEMAGETDPHGDGYWIAPHTNLYMVKQDGWKYTHALQTPAADILAQVGPGSVYEGPNLIAQEPEKAAALWTALQEQLAIPTQFLFLPAVERP